MTHDPKHRLTVDEVLAVYIVTEQDLMKYVSKGHIRSQRISTEEGSLLLLYTKDIRALLTLRTNVKHDTKPALDWSQFFGSSVGGVVGAIGGSLIATQNEPDTSASEEEKSYWLYDYPVYTSKEGLRRRKIGRAIRDIRLLLGYSISE